METIKSLYWSISNDAPEEMPECVRLRTEFYEWYDTLDETTANRAEEFFGGANSLCTMEGFCWGFAYAMKIATECGTTGKGGAAK